MNAFEAFLFVLFYFLLALGATYEEIFGDQYWHFIAIVVVFLAYAGFRIILRKRLRNETFSNIHGRNYQDPIRILYTEARNRAHTSTLLIGMSCFLLIGATQWVFDLEANQGGHMLIIFIFVTTPNLLTSAYAWHLLHTKFKEFGIEAEAD